MSTNQSDPSPRSTLPASRVQRAESLAGWAKLALIGSALLWLVETVGALWLADVFDQEGQLVDFFVQWYESAPGLIALGWLGTGTLFVWWHWSARRALRVVRRGNLQRSDAATLGWWFVPLANLVMPFKVVSETYRASTTPAGGSWHSAETAQLVQAWTTAFLVGFLTLQVVPGLADFTQESTYFLWYASGAAFMALAGCLAIRIVGHVTEGLRDLLNRIEDEAPADHLDTSGLVEADPGVPDRSIESTDTPPLAEWEVRVSTLETLAASGALPQLEASRRAMALLTDLNADVSASGLDAGHLAELNTRLLRLCENIGSAVSGSR